MSAAVIKSSGGVFPFGSQPWISNSPAELCHLFQTMIPVAPT